MRDIAPMTCLSTTNCEGSNQRLQATVLLHREQEPTMASHTVRHKQIFQSWIEFGSSERTAKFTSPAAKRLLAVEAKEPAMGLSHWG